MQDDKDVSTSSVEEENFEDQETQEDLDVAVDESEETDETEDTDQENTDEENEKLTRLDQHPRFKQVIEEKNRYKKEYEQLKEELARKPEVVTPPKKVTAEENVKQSIKNELIEEDFLEDLGETNSYDGEKIISNIKPMALTLLEQGKARNYREALRKAHAYENMDSEIEKKVALQLQGKKQTTAAIGAARNLADTNDELSATELLVAKQMGISAKEYQKYK